MFESIKNPGVKKTEVKENVSQFVDNAKQNANDLADEAKSAVDRVSSKVEEKGRETKAEALNVLESLKTLLAQYTDLDRATEIKNQIVDKAVSIKDTVQDEVSNAYHTGKDRTVQTVQERPITALAVALGAGILLGYILGSKQSSK